MKIKPVLTEKSMLDAQNGKYTFWVSPSFTKGKIKESIGKAFGVSVVSVRTQNKAKCEKVNLMRRKTIVKAKKKTVVTLKDKQKIGLFEAEKKKK